MDKSFELIGYKWIPPLFPALPAGVHVLWIPVALSVYSHPLTALHLFSSFHSCTSQTLTFFLQIRPFDDFCCPSPEFHIVVSMAVRILDCSWSSPWALRCGHIISAAVCLLSCPPQLSLLARGTSRLHMLWCLQMASHMMPVTVGHDVLHK